MGVGGGPGGVAFGLNQILVITFIVFVEPAYHVTRYDDTTSW